jgi:hypothetical protein
MIPICLTGRKDRGMNKCRYCSKKDGHKEGCPTLHANAAWAIGEWEKGYEEGWDDKRISRSALWDHCSEPFRNGYCEAQRVVNEMIDAYQSPEGSGWDDDENQEV